MLSNYYFENNSTENHNESQHKISSGQTGTVDWPCQLFTDFMTEKRVSSYMLTLLGSNLLHLPQGEHIFFDRLEEIDSPHYGRMKSNIAYHKKNSYFPTNCDKCKYSEECMHGKNMLETVMANGAWNNYLKNLEEG